MSVTSSEKKANSVTVAPSLLCVVLPSKPG